MEVILERAAAGAPSPRLRLEEVDRSPERELCEIEHEDRDPPLLVHVVNGAGLSENDGANAHGHANDDHGPRYSHTAMSDSGRFEGLRGAMIEWTYRWRTG